MTAMIAEVRDALKPADADDAEAHAAAAPVAHYHRDIAGSKPDMRLVKWMVDLVLAGVAGLVARAFV